MRFGIWEIVLVALLVIILFNSAKIPAMMKNLADGVKVFKKEVKTQSPKKSKSKGKK